VAAARHVLCEKQGKINEAYKKLQEGWLDNGDKVPPAEFAKVIGRLINPPVNCIHVICETSVVC
jgi:NIMA-interacting peptidyl-prolyl cis-trans isomerase 4